MPMICPICQEQGQKSKVRFIGTKKEVEPLWDYDEEGRVIERIITVKIVCDRGHETDAKLMGHLDKAEQH